jgi:hypothetical protein
MTKIKIKIKIKKDPMEIELDRALNRMIKDSRLNQNRFLAIETISTEELETKSI